MRDIKLESLEDVLRYMDKSKIDLCLDVFDLMKENYRLKHEIKELKVEIEALRGKIKRYIEYQEECDSYHSH